MTCKICSADSLVCSTVGDATWITLNVTSGNYCWRILPDLPELISAPIHYKGIFVPIGS